MPIVIWWGLAALLGGTGVAVAAHEVKGAVGEAGAAVDKSKQALGLLLAGSAAIILIHTLGKK